LKYQKETIQEQKLLALRRRDLILRCAQSQVAQSFAGIFVCWQLGGEFCIPSFNDKKRHRVVSFFVGGEGEI
jgi:hypothetical protein